MIIATWLLCFIAGSAFAQKVWNTNWAVGPHLSMSFPQSDFADITKTGEGLGAKVFYRIESVPYFLPRLDFTYLSFGEKRSSLFEGYASYYDYITTRTESFQLLLGPQFATKFGRVSLYFAPMFGLFNFRTLETIPIYYDPYYQSYYSYYTETTHSLTRPGWAVNGGLYFDLGLGPVIDFELKYQNISNAVQHTVNDQQVKSDVADLGISLGVVFFINKTKKRRY